MLLKGPERGAWMANPNWMPLWPPGVHSPPSSRGQCGGPSGAGTRLTRTRRRGSGPGGPGGVRAVRQKVPRRAPPERGAWMGNPNSPPNSSSASTAFDTTGHGSHWCEHWCEHWREHWCEHWCDHWCEHWCEHICFYFFFLWRFRSAPSGRSNRPLDSGCRGPYSL